MSDETKNNNTPETGEKEANVVRLSDMISKKRTEKNVLSGDDAKDLRRRKTGGSEPISIADGRRNRREAETEARQAAAENVPVKESPVKEAPRKERVEAAAAGEMTHTPEEKPKAKKPAAKAAPTSDQAFAKLRAAAVRKTTRDVEKSEPAETLKTPAVSSASTADDSASEASVQQGAETPEAEEKASAQKAPAQKTVVKLKTVPAKERAAEAEELPEEEAFDEEDYDDEEYYGEEEYEEEYYEEDEYEEEYDEDPEQAPRRRREFSARSFALFFEELPERLADFSLNSEKALVHARDGIADHVMNSRIPLRIKIRLFFAVLIIALCAFIASLRITNVTYEGNTRYTDGQMSAMIFGEGFASNPIIFKINEKLNGKVDIPFVEKYTVALTGLYSAEVTVYEKVIAGCVDTTGSYMYFDKDGYVVESSATLREDIPLVSGLQSDSLTCIVPDEKIEGVKDEVFQEILNITLFLQKSTLTWEGKDTTLIEMLDELAFDSSYKVRCVFGDLRVSLGTSEHMEEKLLEMYDILPKLEGKSGTLYLDTFNPLATESSYIFKDTAQEEAEAAESAAAEARETDPAYIEQEVEAAQNADEKRAEEAQGVDLTDPSETSPAETSPAETSPAEGDQPAEGAEGEAAEGDAEGEAAAEPEGQAGEEGAEGEGEAPAAE